MHLCLEAKTIANMCSEVAAVIKNQESTYTVHTESSQNVETFCLL